MLLRQHRIGSNARWPSLFKSKCVQSCACLIAAFFPKPCIIHLPQLPAPAFPMALLPGTFLVPTSKPPWRARRPEAASRLGCCEHWLGRGEPLLPETSCLDKCFQGSQAARCLPTSTPLLLGPASACPRFQDSCSSQLCWAGSGEQGTSLGHRALGALATWNVVCNSMARWMLYLLFPSPPCKFLPKLNVFCTQLCTEHKSLEQ